MESPVRFDPQTPGYPHLGPMLCAFVAAVVLLGSVHAYVSRTVPDRLPFYAAHAMSIKVNGNALQTIAFRTPNELPIYGSSELDRWADNRADAFFYHRPTGFAVFPIGRGGATCLMIQQKIAAVGNAARGKKTVIFLSPSWFVQASVKEDAVNANLGVSQVSAWVFGGDLGRALKTETARRMQDFSGILPNQLLLADAVRCLAQPTLANRLHLALLYPLGRLQCALLNSLDYGAIFWEMIFLQKRWLEEGDHDQNPPSVTGGRVEWDQLAAQADANEQKRADGTISNTSVRTGEVADINHQPLPSNTGEHDNDFAARLKASREFDDLELLVRVLKELHVKALFIIQPFNGIHSDSEGISARIRRTYYERLQRALSSTGYPLRDFSEHEEDRFFFNALDHPSAKAWVFYDREIDRFYSRARD